MGLIVGFNGVYNVYVEVSGRYKGELLGLCGNFNCKKEDDFVNSAAAFGNSWKVEKSCGDTTNIPNRCRSKNAWKLCSAFKRGPLKSCNRVLNPASYIRNCVYDVCRCKGYGIACLCQAYAAYSEDCAAATKRFRPEKLRNYEPFRRCG